MTFRPRNIRHFRKKSNPVQRNNFINHKMTESVPLENNHERGILANTSLIWDIKLENTELTVVKLSLHIPVIYKIQISAWVDVLIFLRTTTILVLPLIGPGHQPWTLCCWSKAANIKSCQCSYEHRNEASTYSVCLFEEKLYENTATIIYGEKYL